MVALFSDLISHRRGVCSVDGYKVVQDLMQRLPAPVVHGGYSLYTANLGQRQEPRSTLFHLPES